MQSLPQKKRYFFSNRWANKYFLMQNSSCSCNCSQLLTDIEGIKLDIAIIESKIGNTIADNTNNTEIIKVLDEQLLDSRQNEETEPK